MGADERAPGDALELMSMGVSVGVTFAGILLAGLFFLRQPARADALAERFAGLYRVLSNKYYVDELYDRVIVQPTKRASTVILWRAVDASFIDGAVDGVGVLVRAASSRLRRVQSGSVRAYAASLFIGAILILGYHLWRR